MTMQLRVEYEQVIELVEQLSAKQQKNLISHLLNNRGQQYLLTPNEKIALLDAAKVSNSINEAPSIRREDWYGDDGR